MSAGDVPQFMRDHALHLVGIIGRMDQAAMDVDRLTTRHEGVDRRVVEQDYVDIAWRKARGLDQRIGEILQERLGLCIAQDGLRHCGLRAQRQGEHEG